MQIVFDPQKDLSNIQKHGLSLNHANDLEWSMLWSFEDKRRDYDEIRIIGYAPINNRVFNVIFVDRGLNRRIISFRKANNREILKYENWLQSFY